MSADFYNQIGSAPLSNTNWFRIKPYDVPNTVQNLGCCCLSTASSNDQQFTALDLWNATEDTDTGNGDAINDPLKWTFGDINKVSLSPCPNPLAP